MKDKKFAKDLDKVLKDVSGLEKTGKTELGGRRGKENRAFNSGYAEGGSGGIGDMLGGMLGGGSSKTSKSKSKARMKAPSARDIEFSRSYAKAEKRSVHRVKSSSKSTAVYASAPAPKAGKKRRGGEWTPGVPTSNNRQAKLRAGYHDDNKDWGRYLEYRHKFRTVALRHLQVEDRLVLKVLDENGKPQSNRTILLGENGQTKKYQLLSDGSLNLYAKLNRGKQGFVLQTTQGDRFDLKPDAKEMILQLATQNDATLPILDVAFIMDCTGSMSEEINRLTTTLLKIHENLVSSYPNVDIRYALVEYRDRHDRFMIRPTDFTGDANAFQKKLSRMRADGGGDNPEALEEALEHTVENLSWRDGAAHLGILITDAPQKTYKSNQEYQGILKGAQAKGIRIHTLGTGGLNPSGEFTLREVSQFTRGKYLFLHYGESGESDGGAPGSASHHTGSNYSVKDLDKVILSLAEAELENMEVGQSKQN